LLGVGILADRTDSQVRLGPHKKIDHPRVGTTLRGDHARPPWSLGSAPSHIPPSYPPLGPATLSKHGALNSPSFRRCNIKDLGSAPGRLAMAAGRAPARGQGGGAAPKRAGR
jgi:hypothetical protein